MWLSLIAFALVLGSLSLLVAGRELRRQVPARTLALTTLLLVPLAGLLLYPWLGSSQDLRILAQIEAMAARAAEGTPPTQAERQQLMATLRHRAQQTGSIEYWYLLANQYLAEGQYVEAAESFAQASALSPEDVSLKAAEAEARFMAEGNRLTPPVRDLITQVRAQDPRNATVNSLLGIAAFQVREWQLAVDYWQVALEGLPPASAEARAIQTGIDQARLQLGESGALQESQAAGLELEIAVSLDPAIDAPADTTVFVFARPAEGVAMPVAVKRLTVADLPARVTLSDADAMVESLQMSRFDSLDLVARLAFNGTPTPAPGDYEGVLEGWSPETGAQLELVIRDPIR